MCISTSLLSIVEAALEEEPIIGVRDDEDIDAGNMLPSVQDPPAAVVRDVVLVGTDVHTDAASSLPSSMTSESSEKRKQDSEDSNSPKRMYETYIFCMCCTYHNLKLLLISKLQDNDEQPTGLARLASTFRNFFG
jgi:hypothetical protein